MFFFESPFQLGLLDLLLSLRSENSVFLASKSRGGGDGWMSFGFLSNWV